MPQQTLNKKDLLVLAVFLSVMFLQLTSETAVSVKENILYGGRDTVAVKTKNVDYFAGIEIAAKAAFVWDAKENKVLFARNENVPLPLASLAKIMTALLSLEDASAKGNKILITKEAVAEEGDNGLIVGEKWETGELAKLTLVSSANDGARALALAFAAVPSENGGRGISFVELMNARAKRLGLSQMSFSNETGLDLSETKPSAYGSAKDVANLFYYAVSSYPDVFGATNRRELSVKASSYSGEIKHKVKNTNESVEGMPGIVASKTGFTNLAGGNLAVFASLGLNHPVIAVVLGSTEEERFSDVSKLLSAATETLGNK